MDIQRGIGINVPNGQYGRLYITSNYNEVIGYCVTIVVLPKEFKAPEHYRYTGKDVIVFGQNGGRSYGWLHHGTWVKDVEDIITEYTRRRELKEVEKKSEKDLIDKAILDKQKSLLSDY